MNYNFTKKMILFGVILFQTDQMQAMEGTPTKGGQKDPNVPLVSLSLRANFSEADKKKISDAVKPGLDAAVTYIGTLRKPWYFTAQMEKPHGITGVMTLPEYHISLAVIEHGKSTDKTKKLLGKNHTECLKSIWKTYIGNPSQYTGQNYSVHMYVHGYDKDNQEMHQHYTLPTTDISQVPGLYTLKPYLMTLSLHDVFPKGISHVHYVLAYEPNEYTYGGVSRPDIVTNVNNLMAAIKTKRNDPICPMKDLYEQNFGGFEAHTTIGVLKTGVGKMTPQSPRILPTDYNMIVNIYDYIFNGFDKSKLTNISFDHFSINGMGTDNKQKAVVRTLQEGTQQTAVQQPQYAPYVAPQQQPQQPHYAPYAAPQQPQYGGQYGTPQQPQYGGQYGYSQQQAPYAPYAAPQQQPQYGGQYGYSQQPQRR